MADTQTADVSHFIRELDDTDFYVDDQAGTPDTSPAARSLFCQYEEVVVRSLFTSFGLDSLLFTDQKGGDVDTLLTVRDKEIGFKNAKHETAYQNRGDYNSNQVHSDSSYRTKNKEVSEAKKSGNLRDAYTGEKLSPNAHVDLDHVVSAKEVHDDRGRVLAGLDTAEIANIPANLQPTERSINRSKKAKSASEFVSGLDKKAEERQCRIQELKGKECLDDKESQELHKLERLESVDKKRFLRKDEEARRAQDRILALKYYTSHDFLADTAKASLNSGVKMGLRQSLGLILAEVWFVIREEFPRLVDRMKADFDLGELFRRLDGMVKKAFEKVRAKFGKLIASFKDGALAGVLASVATTVTNIFFVTAKNVARILRETWSSLLEALKILFFNPDNLPWGDRLKAAAKVIAVGAGVIVGGLVQEAAAKAIHIPLLNEVLPQFLGALVGGVLSVSLVYFLDHSAIVNKIVAFINELFRDGFRETILFFKEANEKLDRYVARLNAIDYASFAREILAFRDINIRLEGSKTEKEMNLVLHEVMRERKILLPYEDLCGLDAFMNDKNAVLVI